MMVEIDNVWKRFGHFEALEGMTLAVPEGSIFALIGPNGAANQWRPKRVAIGSCGHSTDGSDARWCFCLAWLTVRDTARRISTASES